MSSAEMSGLREQIMANAKIMLRPFDNPLPVTKPRSLSTHESSSTLVPENSGPGPSGDLEVVVFGGGKEYTGAVMVGVTPAIEGGEAITPEAALRKLLIATCEILHSLMPKVGAHQRAIHGGGVFDEDLISQELNKPS